MALIWPKKGQHDLKLLPTWRKIYRKMREARQWRRRREKRRKRGDRPKVLGRFSGPKKPGNRAPVEGSFFSFYIFSNNVLNKRADEVGFGKDPTGPWGDLGAS